MDTPRTLRISLIAILALGCAARADAFIAGDPCVSPYVIADGDIASLRAAIACANTDGTDSVVELATNGSYVFTSADTSNSTRALNSIGANGAFTLLGHGATLHRDAASVDSFGILEVSNSAVVEINEVTLSGGLATAFGGGMRIRGAVRASSIRVVDNVSTAAGGGIMLSNNGTLVLTDSTVANNTSDADGAPRTTRHRRGNGPRAVITDFGVLIPDPLSRELVVSGLYADASIDEARTAVGWPLRFADTIELIVPPSTLELDTLRALQARTREAHARPVSIPA